MPDSTGALRSVLAYFGVEVDTTKLDKANAKLDGLIAQAELAAVAVAEAFAIKEIAEAAAGLFHFVDAQVQAATHVQDLADRLGVTATNLKAFSMIAANTGLDLDTAGHALGQFQAILGKLEDGSGGAAKALAAVGLHLQPKNKGLFDSLEDVADQLSKIPDQNEKAAAAMALFGRQWRVLLPVLAQSKEAFVAQLREAKGLSDVLGDEYYAAAKRARGETQKLGFVWEAIEGKVASALLPAFTWIIAKATVIARWMLDIAAKTHALSHAFQIAAVVAGGALATAIVTLAASFWSLLWPIAAIAAALVALYLTFDDVATFLEGGDSLIGRAIDRLFGEGAHKELLDQLKTTFRELRDAWTDVVNAFRTGEDIHWDKITDGVKLLAGVVAIAIPPLGVMAGAIWAVVRAYQALHGINVPSIAPSTGAPPPGIDLSLIDRKNVVEEPGNHARFHNEGGATGSRARPASTAPGQLDLTGIDRRGAKETGRGARFSNEGGGGASIARPEAPKGPGLDLLGLGASPNVLVLPPSSAGKGGPAPVIHQDIRTNVVVHGAGNDPASHSDATFSAVATGVEKANSNALQSIPGN
jgi:hypothetical protein